MALNIYDTMKPKGNFPIAQAEDIEMPDGSRLSDNTNASFANVIKQTATGNTITMQGVSPIEHTVGCYLTRKNLCPIPEKYHPDNGEWELTITQNVDGTFNYTGYRIGGVVICVFVLSSGVYTFSASSENFQIYAPEKQDLLYSGTKFTITYEQRIEIVLTDMVETSHTVNNCWVQLEKGTTATPYTPYIADLSTVEVSRYGKNLYKPEFHRDESMVKYTDGVLFVPQYGGNTLICHSVPLYVPQNTWLCYKHTLLLGKDRLVIRLFNSKGENISTSAKTNIDCSSIYYLSAYKGYVVDTPANGFSFKVTSEVAYITLGYCGMNSEGGNKYGDLQLKLGTTATEYEPYIKPTVYNFNTDGTPTETIKSISPNMTLISSDEGAVINCNYNVDTKTYIDNKFTELQALILEG